MAGLEISFLFDHSSQQVKEKELFDFLNKDGNAFVVCSYINF